MVGWRRESRLKEEKRSDLKAEFGSVPPIARLNHMMLSFVLKGGRLWIK